MLGHTETFLVARALSLEHGLSTFPEPAPGTASQGPAQCCVITSGAIAEVIRADG